MHIHAKLKLSKRVSSSSYFLTYMRKYTMKTERMLLGSCPFAPLPYANKGSMNTVAAVQHA